MQPPSSKFANLGPPGIARRFAKEVFPPLAATVAKATKPRPKKKAKRKSAKAAAKKRSPRRVSTLPRYKRWRQANPDLHKKRHRAYMKRYRAKKKAAAKKRGK